MARFPWINCVVCLACAAAMLVAQPCSAYDRQLCVICGRDWARSPSRIRFNIVLDKHPKQYFVCSPFCLFEKLEHYEDREYELQGAQIVDYSSLTEETERWAILETATFLWGTQGEIKLSAEPFSAAFARKATAQKAQAVIGGELLDWDGLAKVGKKAAKDYQPETPSRRGKPDRRPS